MQSALKTLARKIVPPSIRNWRSDRINARSMSTVAALPLADKFDHIYRTGIWGRGEDGKMSSGEGSRDALVVAPYVAAVSSVLRQLPNGVRLVDIGAGDFSVGSQLLPDVGSYVACDISSLIVAQNRGRYQNEAKVEFRVLDATTDDLPAGDVVTIRQVLQHLSNAQVAAILPKLSAYAAIIITEAVPGTDFVANVDHQPGFSTRVIESGSGVDLAQAPFNLPHVAAQVLCEPATSLEEVGGRIRTTLYVTEKGRALGL